MIYGNGTKDGESHAPATWIETKVSVIGSVIYCGDPHGAFAHIVAAAQSGTYDAVVILGDLDLTRPLGDELGEIADQLWFIPGNHDSDSDAAWSCLCDGPLADRNLHGRVVELPCGVRLAGLGGVFRQSVWHPDVSAPPTYQTQAEHVKATPRQHRWRGTGPPRKHLSTIYPDDVDRLSSLRANVLVLHEAPGYHPYGIALLDDLAQAMGVRVVVHGHHHDALDSSAAWATQGFRSHGVGLRGLTAIDAEGQATMVRAGELDHVRGTKRGDLLQQAR